MLLVPVGPLATGSLVWRTRKGAFSQTVVCKATFSLAPGRSLLAAQQDPAREHDVYAGLDPARWLWAPADLVPYKMRADVVLVGHAHAPGDVPVRSLRVRLVVAGIDKSLEVRCDRRRALDGRVLEGTPAARFPLGWDRAAYAPSNPVGVIAGRAPDAYGTVPLPSVGWPDEATRPRPDALVAGFGPIAPWWPGRIEKLGRYRAAALQPSWQGAALPEDADDALFQVAPADQQVPRLESEPRLMLENLLAGHPRLETQLALVTPHARVERPGRAPEPLSLVADTLWIDTDRGVCAVTWRGWLMLSHADEAGTVRLWADGVEARAPVPVAGGDAPARPEVPARAGFDPRETSAVDPMAVLTGVRALPFAGPPSAPPNAGAAPSQGPSAPVFGAPPPSQGPSAAGISPAPGASTSPHAGSSPAPGTSSPLHAGISVPPGASPPFHRWDPRETAAVDPSTLGPGLLPFAAAPEGASPPVFERSAPAPRRFDPRETSAVDPAVALAALGVLPFGARDAAGAEGAPPLAAPVAVSPPPAVPPPLRAPASLVEEAPSEDRPTNPLEIAPFDVPPPAWIGPPPAVPSGTEAAEGAAPAEIAPPPLLGSVPAEIAPPASRAETAPAQGGGDRRAELERKWRARESLEGIDLSGLSLAGIDLSGASLLGASLEKVDLSNAKLSGANLTRARLSGARFGGADLTGATLAYSAGAGASFAGALLARANVRAGELRDADFSGADVSEARFDGAVLDGSGFSQVKGAGSSWDRASLAKCAFSGADLRGASFVEAACARADFARSQLGKASFRAARCEGASFEEVDAANARLLDVSAPSASFRKAKLEGAQLRGAKLAKSSFTEAVLRRSMADGADFSSADLGRADFGRASLREASFQGAILVEAILEGADLRGADLTRANASRAALGSAKLDGIKKDGAEGI